MALDRQDILRLAPDDKRRADALFSNVQRKAKQRRPITALSGWWRDNDLPSCGGESADEDISLDIDIPGMP